MDGLKRMPPLPAILPKHQCVAKRQENFSETIGARFPAGAPPLQACALPKGIVWDRPVRTDCPQGEGDSACHTLPISQPSGLDHDDLLTALSADRPMIQVMADSTPNALSLSHSWAPSARPHAHQRYRKTTRDTKQRLEQVNKPVVFLPLASFFATRFQVARRSLR